jgi:hypothetical protein
MQRLQVSGYKVPFPPEAKSGGTPQNHPEEKWYNVPINRMEVLWRRFWCG